MKNPILVPELRGLLKKKNYQVLRSFLDDHHEKEIAEYLGLLTPDEIWNILNLTDIYLRAKIFSYLDMDVQVALVSGELKKYINELLMQMSHDDRADLFQHLERDKAQILIPSIVIAEFVIPLNSRKEREEVIARMRDRFIIAPFDAKDAALAAELWREGKKDREMKKQGARVWLKADALIIATACGHGAQIFYTDDDDCFNMASKVMTTKRLPNIPPDLMGYAQEQ